MSDATSQELLKNAPSGGAPVPARPCVWAILSVVCYYAFGVVVPLVPVPLHPHNPLPWFLLQFVATLFFMALQLWVPWAVLATRPSIPKSIAGAILCAIGWALTLIALNHPYSLPRGDRHAAMALLQPLNGLLLTVSLAYFGGLLSRIIREAKILLPVGVIAGLVDVFGAMVPTGYTANMVAQHPSVVRAVSVSVPTVGSLHPVGLVGPGDALFLGFFFATVLRFGMNARGSFWLTYTLLTISMLIVLSPLPINIGALMPMGVAMIIANFRYFKFTREESFAMLYAGVIVLAAAALFFSLTNRFVFHHR